MGMTWALENGQEMQKGKAVEKALVGTETRSREL